MSKTVNLIKLSVGSETIDTLTAWQSTPHAQGDDGLPRHITRMWPRREAELLNGGSIYWVIQGLIQCRQKVLRLDEVIGGDGIRRCAIVLDQQIIPVTQTPRRPFQGWRYLAVQDSPPDLAQSRQNEPNLPSDMANALADMGVV